MIFKHWWYHPCWCDAVKKTVYQVVAGTYLAEKEKASTVYEYLILNVLAQDLQTNYVCNFLAIPVVKCRVVNYFNASTSVRLSPIWKIYGIISHAYWKNQLLHAINLQIFFMAESFFANLVQLWHHTKLCSLLKNFKLCPVDSKFDFTKNTLRNKMNGMGHLGHSQVKIETR